jgi:hypothetical protein
MGPCRELLYARARRVAERYNMDPRRACQSLTPIGLNGKIAIGATGTSFNTPILDVQNPSAPAAGGDHITFTSKGEQKYLLLGFFDDENTAAPTDWGYRELRWNGNNVKNNFEGSFETDAVHSAFFNLEAVRSGVEAFPWDCLPAFGPNNVIDIGIWSTDAAIVSFSALAYAMPVNADYQPLISVANPMGTPAVG